MLAHILLIEDKLKDMDVSIILPDVGHDFKRPQGVGQSQISRCQMKDMEKSHISTQGYFFPLKTYFQNALIPREYDKDAWNHTLFFTRENSK